MVQPLQGERGYPARTPFFRKILAVHIAFWIKAFGKYSLSIGLDLFSLWFLLVEVEAKKEYRSKTAYAAFRIFLLEFVSSLSS